MFMHVGADVVISLNKIIGVFDLRSSSKAETTKEFIALMHSTKKVMDIGGKDAKSLVLTDTMVYLSPISSLTLKKRADLLHKNLLIDLSATSS